jgi:hypothetical protein
MTGDGTADPYTLMPSEDGSSCTLTITPGDTTGPYAGLTSVLAVPPVSYGCPDLIATGDTAGDRKMRLAMGWFFCAPEDLLLVAASSGSFTITTYPGEDCPSTVQTADLNGDGRADFWMASDNPGGLWTWLGQPDGSVAPDLTVDSTEYASLYSEDFVTMGLPKLMHSRVDNRTELLMFAQGSGENVPPTDLIVYAYGAPLSYLASSVGDAALYDGPWSSAMPADANNDGWPDVNVDVGSSEFTAFQRPNHSFYLGVTATVSTTVYGQHPHMVSHVAQTSASRYPPTGTMTLIVDGVARKPIRVSSSKASTPLPVMDAGTHTLVATYSGDTRHPGTSSPPVSFTVRPAATAIKLSTSDKSSSHTAAWTNAVVVSAVKPGKGAPTGVLTITLDGVAQPPVVLIAGKARFSFSHLTIGTHTLTARYSGDANFNPSTLATIHHKVT